MVTHVKYRDAGAVVPTETSVKGAPLSNAEIDGNFKSLVDSVDAKVDSSDLAAPGGSALPTASQSGTNSRKGMASDIAAAVRAAVASLNQAVP